MIARTRCYAFGMAIGFCLPGTTALAEGSTFPKTELGAAIGVSPDYLGSDDTEIAPLFSVAITTDRFTFRNNGQGVEVDLSRAFGAANGVIGWGPILRYDGGRNDGSKVKDPVVSRMAPVEASFEAGGFLEAAVPVLAAAGGDPLLLSARLSVVQGLDGGHEGLLAEAEIGLVKPLGRWTVGGGVTLAAGDADYTNAFFGVSSADAAATGLARFQAEGGVRDAGLGAFASYAVNDRLAVDLSAGFSTLLGDAADSPVVADRGRAEQAFVGIGVTWRFR